MSEDYCHSYPVIDDRDRKLTLETKTVLEKLYPRKFPKEITLDVKAIPLTELSTENDQKYSFVAEISTKNKKHTITGTLCLNNTEDICYCGYHVAQQIAIMIALPVNRPYKISKDSFNEPYDIHQPYLKTLSTGEYSGVAYATIPLEEQDVDPEYYIDTMLQTARYIYDYETPPDYTEDYKLCSKWWVDITWRNHTMLYDFAIMERNKRIIEKMFIDLSIIDIIEKPASMSASVAYEFFSCFTFNQLSALANTLYDSHVPIYSSITFGGPYVLDSPVIVEIFLTHPNPIVRGMLAQNHRLPKHYLEKLVKDKDFMVSSIARHYVQHELWSIIVKRFVQRVVDKYDNFMYGNYSSFTLLGVAILAFSVGSWYYDNYWILFYSVVTPIVLTLIIGLTYVGYIKLAKTRVVPSIVLQSWAESDNPQTLKKVLQNPKTSSETLAFIGGRVKWKNRIVGVSIRGKEKISGIQYDLLAHPHCPNKVLEKAVCFAVDTRLMYLLSKHHNASEETRIMAGLRATSFKNRDMKKIIFVYEESTITAYSVPKFQHIAQEQSLRQMEQKRKVERAPLSHKYLAHKLTAFIKNKPKNI